MTMSTIINLHSRLFSPQLSKPVRWTIHKDSIATIIEERIFNSLERVSFPDKAKTRVSNHVHTYVHYENIWTLIMEDFHIHIICVI